MYQFPEKNNWNDNDDLIYASLLAVFGETIPAEILEMELDQGIESKGGKRALQLAIEANQIHLVRYLLSCGSSALIPDKQNNTPLHWVILNNADPAIIDLLLEHIEGNFAVNHNLEQTQKRQKAASVEEYLKQVNSSGQTALHLALYSLEKMQLFFKKLIDESDASSIYATSSIDVTPPLYFAYERQHLAKNEEDIVETQKVLFFLLKHINENEMLKKNLDSMLGSPIFKKLLIPDYDDKKIIFYEKHFHQYMQQKKYALAELMLRWGWRSYDTLGFFFHDEHNPPLHLLVVNGDMEAVKEVLRNLNPQPEKEELVFENIVNPDKEQLSNYVNQRDTKNRTVFWWLFQVMPFVDDWSSLLYNLNNRFISNETIDRIKSWVHEVFPRENIFELGADFFDKEEVREKLLTFLPFKIEEIFNQKPYHKILISLLQSNLNLYQYDKLDSWLVSTSHGLKHFTLELLKQSTQKIMEEMEDKNYRTLFELMRMVDYKAYAGDEQTASEAFTNNVVSRLLNNADEKITTVFLDKLNIYVNSLIALHRSKKEKAIRNVRKNASQAIQLNNFNFIIPADLRSAENIFFKSADTINFAVANKAVAENNLALFLKTRVDLGSINKAEEYFKYTDTMKDQLKQLFSLKSPLLSSSIQRKKQVMAYFLKICDIVKKDECNELERVLLHALETQDKDLLRYYSRIILERLIYIPTLLIESRAVCCLKIHIPEFIEQLKDSKLKIKKGVHNDIPIFPEEINTLNLYSVFLDKLFSLKNNEICKRFALNKKDFFYNFLHTKMELLQYSSCDNSEFFPDNL